jgi:thymidylate synthase (FAD)
MLEKIERAARLCYKSEDKIEEGSAEKLVKGLIKSNHMAMIEHIGFSADIICDRGISHEIVRHRLFSFAQESSRYCNYSKGKFDSEIKVIRPSGLSVEPLDSDKALALSMARQAWEYAMKQAENQYMWMLDLGMSTDIARSVLPTCTATEIFVTGNVREWRHFFELRTDSHAHPDMQVIAKSLLKQCRENIPIFFDDVGVL